MTAPYYPNLSWSEQQARRQPRQTDMLDRVLGNRFKAPGAPRAPELNTFGNPPSSYGQGGGPRAPRAPSAPTQGFQQASRYGAPPGSTPMLGAPPMGLPPNPFTASQTQFATPTVDPGQTPPGGRTRPGSLTPPPPQSPPSGGIPYGAPRAPGSGQTGYPTSNMTPAQRAAYEAALQDFQTRDGNWDELYGNTPYGNIGEIISLAYGGSSNDVFQQALGGEYAAGQGFQLAQQAAAHILSKGFDPTSPDFWDLVYAELQQTSHIDPGTGQVVPGPPTDPTPPPPPAPGEDWYNATVDGTTPFSPGPRAGRRGDTNAPGGLTPYTGPVVNTQSPQQPPTPAELPPPPTSQPPSYPQQPTQPPSPPGGQWGPQSYTPPQPPPPASPPPTSSNPGPILTPPGQPVPPNRGTGIGYGWGSGGSLYPPSQTNPALRQFAEQGLANPSRYDDNFVRSMWDSIAGDIDTQFDDYNQDLTGDLSSRGIRDSTFGGQEQQRLAGQRRDAKSRGAQQLMESVAANMAGDRASAFRNAMDLENFGEGQRQFGANFGLQSRFGDQDRDFRERQFSWDQRREEEDFNFRMQQWFDEMQKWMLENGML